MTTLAQNSIHLGKIVNPVYPAYPAYSAVPEEGCSVEAAAAGVDSELGAVASAHQHIAVK